MDQPNRYTNAVGDGDPSIADRLRRLDEACDRVGRDRADIDVSVFGATTDPSGLANLFDEGVHRVVLTLASHHRDEALRQLDEWAPLTDDI